jgi:hypothetical protein
MSLSLRRSLRTGVRGALLCAGLAVLVSQSATVRAKSSCAALQQWAQQYRDASFSLDQLANFDRAHRLAIFGTVSPEVRAALWREQIRRLGDRPDLTAAQRALTVEGVALLTPALYRHEPRATAAFQGFEQRVDRAFVTMADQRVWRDLGVLNRLVPDRRAMDVEFCECKVGLGSAQCGGVPCGGAEGCRIIQACGFTGLQICDGMCQ